MKQESSQKCDYPVKDVKQVLELRLISFRHEMEVCRNPFRKEVLAGEITKLERLIANRKGA